MNPRTTGSSRRARAEAASWVARLHGPDRDRDMERGFKRWLAEDPAHARVFELATEVWQETADLPGELPPRAGKSLSRTARRSRRSLLLAASFLPVAIATAVLVYRHTNHALATLVGEQRTMTLQDGTRLELNTDTELLVRYDDHVREVILKKGEAWFDVAKQPQRPFLVTAGDQAIRALGTTFVVRQDDAATVITLLDGQVEVISAQGRASRQPSQSQLLKPGQRLRIARESILQAPVVPVVDTPPLDKVTAWQRGQVVFEDTPLVEAAAEFNRYSEIKIRLASEDLAGIRVGGTFRVGDIESFANAVAASHKLVIVDRNRQVLLAHRR